MKRANLQRNINRFIQRYNQAVDYHRYNSTPDQADAPYRQRVRQYAPAVEIKVAVVERGITDNPTMIGDRALRRFDICTSPLHLLQAFHPNDYEDPRSNYDPSLLISRKDKIFLKSSGVMCTIVSVNKHGDDGGGPLWYVINCEESLDD